MASETQESQAPNGQRAEDNGVRSFGQRVDRLNDSAQQAWNRTRNAFDDIKETIDLDRRISRRPYGTLATAVGIGYVLGGGLFSPLTARILGLGLRLGVRLAALPFIKEELLTLVAAASDGTDESGSRSRKSKQSTTNKGK